MKPGEDNSQQSLDRSLNSLASFHLACSHKATKTSTPSVIKLSGGGTAGSGEQLSPGPGPPPPASSLIGGDSRINENTPATDNNDDEAEQTVVSTATGTTKSTSAKMEKEYGQANETTMSFVLKLDVEAAAAPVVENTTKDSDRSEEQSPPTLLFAQEIWRSQEPVAVATGTATTITTTGNAMVITSGDDAIATTNSKSQLLQLSLEATSNQEQQIATATTASTLTSVKPVVTYPVAKGAREQVQKIITGSQTTEVLTSRVISQKLSPSSIDQAQLVPVTVNISSQTSTSSSSPNSGGVLCPWQTTMITVQNNQPIYQSKNQVTTADLIHCKQQQVTASNVQTTLHHKCQPVYSTGTSTTAVKDLQRFYTKSLPSSIISANQSAQKIKTVTNVITNPSTIVAQRNNSLSRSQGAQKTRVLPGQFINNQATANNANSQKIQLGNPTQKTTQPIGATNMQKTTLQPVCNNQKVPLLSGNHLPNLKTQQQKLQMPHKISLTVGRQQLQSNTQQINNVSKSSNLVTGIQKYPPPGQHFMACQQAAISQVRSQSTGLQKSQTMATVQTTKLQTTMSNVCKSNSVPNVSKSSQNSNVLKQQIQLQTTSAQLLQGPQIIQKSQQQQSANNLQVQRSITNVHSKVIAPVPNNQRTPVMMNSKVQQQQQQQQQQQTMMRVGISKGQMQAAQTVASLKTISQKPIVNPAKTTVNSQNNVIQQPIIVQRNNNPPQPVKIIQQQQQQQNIIGPQNAPQKQSGCIKTIPPQKPVQRNHAQKIGSNPGVKPLLSSNVTGFTKIQGPTSTQVAQKTCIKTLLPQQTVVTPSNVIAAHKNSPIKIQQQAIQQKQLVMTPQYTQQIRQQVGQIKTLLPITSAMIDSRKDVTENK